MAVNGLTLKWIKMTLIDTITAQLSERLQNQDRVSIALSGGSSPVALYQALSEQDLDWSQVEVTLIDDRDVPSDHPDSNQRLIAETLLQNKARDARFIPLKDWPDGRIPDIGILGMGVDGHFASLFPAMMASGMGFDPADRPSVITTPPMGNPLHPRVTMNLAMILAIPDRVLMVIGDDKIKVLEQAQTSQDLPISRLLAHQGTSITHERI